MSYFFTRPRLRGALAVALLFLFSLFSEAVAQQKEYYPYHSSDTASLFNLAVAQKRSLEAHFTVPKGVSSDYRKSYINLVNKAANDNYRRVRNTALLDSIAAPFVQAIFKEVVAANKDLPPTKLILTRSPVENAYALGDGTIFFNIGLLAKLETEGQVAFVICHELAHIRLQHMERNIREMLDVVHSKDFKKQHKQVSKEKYNRYSKMDSFFEGLTLNNLYHKRSLETQADSLGFMLFANTKYAITDAFTSFELLDKIDNPYSEKPIEFGKYFSCAAYTYDPNHTAAASSSVFDIAPQKAAFAENPDTLKTHPDCMKRLGYVKDLAEKQKMAGKASTYKAGGMARIRDISRREVVQSWFDYGQYDYALFNALLLLKEQPESTYLKHMVLLSQAELKKHRRQHTYAEVVSTESKYNPENLNQLLSFLNNLNTSDFGSISSCFRQNQLKNTAGNGEYALATRYEQAVLEDDQSAAAEAKSAYLKEYKYGRFAKSLLRSSFQ